MDYARKIDAIRLIRKAIRGQKTIPVDLLVSKKHKLDQGKMAPTIERQTVQEGIVLYG